MSTNNTSPEPDSKYCMSCGEEIPTTVIYCPECGIKQDSKETTKRQTEEQSTKKTNNSPWYQIPGIAKENPTRRNVLTGVGYSIGGLFLLGMIGGGSTSDSEATNSQEQYPNAWAHDENTGIVLENARGNSNQFSVTVAGTARNESNQDYEYVQLGFGLYDSFDTKIGDALANTSGLSKGQAWRFEAIGTATETVASFSLEEVTAF